MVWRQAMEDYGSAHQCTTLYPVTLLMLRNSRFAKTWMQWRRSVLFDSTNVQMRSTMSLFTKEVGAGHI